MNAYFLSSWTGFFTLTGSAGMTLVGLLFVVVTLGNNLSSMHKAEVQRTLMTPALYSFGEVLFQGMVVMAPWQSNLPSGVIFTVMGIGGLIYRINAVLMRRKIHLLVIGTPIDLFFHNVVPVLGSIILVMGGGGLIGGSLLSPFAVALSSTLFLVSGIYRIWGETLVLTRTVDN